MSSDQLAIHVCINQLIANVEYTLQGVSMEHNKNAELFPSCEHRQSNAKYKRVL